MTSIFDRLSQQIDGDNPAGISAFDLTDLPNEQKRIMLSLLRNQGDAPEGVSRQTLQDKTDGSLDDFDSLLNILTRNGWVVTLGEPPNLRYRVRFRARRSQQTGYTLWSILFDRAPKV
jgi:hypothetical protein